MRIRVLEIIPTLKRAGAENMVASLACLLDRDRFETVVVSLYDAFPNGLEPVLERGGVRVRHLGKRRGFDPRMYPRLSAVREEFQPHVVHTHSYVLRYALPVFARRGTAMVHTVHNLAGKEADRLGRAIHRYAFRHGVVPVAIAGEVARSVRAVYGVEPETIANGIDTKAFQRPEARLPWRLANGFKRGRRTHRLGGAVGSAEEPAGAGRSVRKRCGGRRTLPPVDGRRGQPARSGARTGRAVGNRRASQFSWRADRHAGTAQRLRCVRARFRLGRAPALGDGGDGRGAAGGRDGGGRGSGNRGGRRDRPARAAGRYSGACERAAVPRAELAAPP